MQMFRHARACAARQRGAGAGLPRATGWSAARRSSSRSACRSKSTSANDPFFGRPARCWRPISARRSLKFELLVPITSTSIRRHASASTITATCSAAPSESRRRRRDRPHGLRRLRRRAHHAGAVQASRLRRRGVAAGGARCPRTSERRHRPAWASSRRWTAARRCTRPTGSGSETNCYVDVWVELLPRTRPSGPGGARLHRAQDFEGDQFTFFKFPLGGPAGPVRPRRPGTRDLRPLESPYARAAASAAGWCWSRSTAIGCPTRRAGLPKRACEDDDAVDRHRSAQPAPRLLPQHRLSRVAGRGLRRACFRRLAATGVLFPYAEFVKRDGARARPAAGLAAASVELLREHLGRRARGEPDRAWRRRLPQHLEPLAERATSSYFHLYAFNLPRQLGANFEMLGSYLRLAGRTWRARARRCRDAGAPHRRGRQGHAVPARAHGKPAALRRRRSRSLRSEADYDDVLSLDRFE